MNNNELDRNQQNNEYEGSNYDHHLAQVLSSENPPPHQSNSMGFQKGINYLDWVIDAYILSNTFVEDADQIHLPEIGLK